MILEIAVNLNHNFIYGYNNEVSAKQIILNHVLCIVFSVYNCYCYYRCNCHSSYGYSTIMDVFSTRKFMNKKSQL